MAIILPNQRWMLMLSSAPARAATVCQIDSIRSIPCAVDIAMSSHQVCASHAADERCWLVTTKQHATRARNINTMGVDCEARAIIDSLRTEGYDVAQWRVPEHRDGLPRDRDQQERQHHLRQHATDAQRRPATAHPLQSRVLTTYKLVRSGRPSKHDLRSASDVRGCI